MRLLRSLTAALLTAVTLACCTQGMWLHAADHPCLVREGKGHGGPHFYNLDPKARRVVVRMDACDEWVIGNADGVRALIEDLQGLLPKMEMPK